MILINLLYVFLIFAAISGNNADCRFKENDNQFDSDYETNYLECDSSPRQVAAIINHHKKSVIDTQEDKKPFSSACMQCYLCLTIARDLNKELHTLHGERSPRILNIEAVKNGTLRKFCNTEFRNYDLRQIQGESVLQKITKKTKHLPSAENLWSKKLKELCLDYLNINGDEHLYQRWFDQSHTLGFDISNFLCRSYGIFQSCRNLKVSINIDAPKPKKSSSFFSIYRK